MTPGTPLPPMPPPTASPPSTPHHALPRPQPPRPHHLRPVPAHPPPPHILSLLGTPSDILTTTTSYFSQIHPWMPFISKHRVHTLYLHLPLPSHPDIALLFLAQKLITTLPPKTPLDVRTPLYSATKHFHLEVENSSALSVPTLQAGMLIALYEIGHAIYPAAYLSVGACASPATVSSPLTSHMSKFALLCQAARLLGQVLTYVATEREGETEVEAQLDRTLHSMLKVAMGVKEPDYDQITFIFSALVALHVPTFRLAPTHPIPPPVSPAPSPPANS
ncbi:hypothetical protein GRF29_1536g426075 [Pseudopithomyces chartarum]|uniref:Uncharacterized protein n=1 Tax=Pseudopithomyces chartarum TaxID=1892770 RepID=A0AAN6LLU6_9PLEO|nr:hypothetical protein GRF29_1536g426075 [Pseudopithomyces chartarum]